MLSSEMFDALAAYFAEQPRVVAAFLYGSQSRGTAQTGSDVDIAVLLEHDAPADPMLRVRYTNELMDLLNRSKADVVNINQASPLLAHRVARDGTVLFATGNGVVGEFIIRAVQQYVDTQPLRDLQAMQTRKFFLNASGERHEQR